MDISPISPVSFAANQPGQSVTRTISVSGVSQVEPSEVTVTVTVDAAGNDPATTSVDVTLDPEDTVPSGTVSVPTGSGIEATLGEFTSTQVGPTLFWNAPLTITTV